MALERRKLLLVEDEALVALDLKRRLEGMGFEVAGQATTGEEAIQKALAIQPSLVLMDIRLGGLVDGIEATEIIRRRLDVPVVYLTANSDEATLRRARITEPHGFVLKPIRDRELRIAIEMALYRFRAEAAMRESREWFSAMLSTVSEAVIANDKDGAVRHMNHAAERLTGWREEEARGRPLTEVVRFLDESARAPAQESASGTRIMDRTVVTARDGAVRAVEERFETVRGLAADVEGGVSAFRDVSERRNLERQLAQKHKMEAIGRLAAGVAHDFNNLLTAIIGYSNLALLKAGERDATREDLSQIKEAGERAAELTQQLLAFSRRQMLTPTVVDLGVMTRNMEKLLRRLIGEDVEILTSGDQPLWAVMADLGQMEQVLVNLAVNARDAMPQGGKLVVDTRNFRLDANAVPPQEDMTPGDYVVLGVADTGSGMDESTRSHLFEPFFTTKAPGKGAGLGLATVYGIVKQSDGYLTVQSEPERGSVFKIFLHATFEPARQSAGPRPQAPAPRTEGNETILVVEDEKAVRNFLRDSLERSGYRVLEAGCGQEALEKAAEAASRGGTLPGNEGEIRLLLTDVVMAGLNGQELAEEVLGLLPGVKVLYISGYTNQGIVNRGSQGGGPDFLRKPFTPMELSRKVRNVLDGQ
ncbi:MAG TPA: response regulator [Fibrobacteria bacterium]|nr:response regulator [Fibrobacteria bacterium]